MTTSELLQHNLVYNIDLHLSRLTSLLHLVQSIDEMEAVKQFLKADKIKFGNIMNILNFSYNTWFFQSCEFTQRKSIK